jgi:5-methylthioadenosine/S-adenosylhomocysteine deaminase
VKLPYPNLLTVREVIEFATIKGAKDNRLDQKIGTLTSGKEADIIMLWMDQINVIPVNNVYGAIVLGMKPATSTRSSLGVNCGSQRASW